MISIKTELRNWGTGGGLRDMLFFDEIQGTLKIIPGKF